jgi:glycosyltransferase involved in cell wall biosynthesis
MQKIGIVIPTRNAKPPLKETLPELRSVFPSSIIFAIDDKSTDSTLTLLKEHNCVVPFRFRPEGYAHSLVEGLTKAFYEYECDIVIEMDADHPVDCLKEFITELNNSDIALGIEEPRRLVSKGASNLARWLLGLRIFKHPTCGLVAFKKEALDTIFSHKPVPWVYFGEKDFIHIEILYNAHKKGLNISEVPFISKGHERMSLRRIISWLHCFCWLFARRFLVHWFTYKLRGW